MTRDSSAPPASRSWKDIPQQVKPRAMSSGGRRRLLLGAVGWAGGLAAAAALGAGVWLVSESWRNPASIPGAKPMPIRDIALVDPNGVLDRAWLVRTLALPPGATLGSLDLPQLRARILASGQVAEAALFRIYPAALSVHVTERAPVARVRAQAAAGAPRTYLVARDGTVYDGLGYPPAVVSSLPWLDGVKLQRRGGGFAPLGGVAGEGAHPGAADLLAQAKLQAEHLYRTWRVVSLAKLDSDGEIVVRPAAGPVVTFGTQEDFSRQLAKLDWLLDTLRARGAGASAIDLSLAYGGSHQVTLTPAPAEDAAAPVPAFQLLSHPIPSVPREF
ncbi:MAG TPA: FtsQ-type POTRA domain-containing protein [Opitutaceae bacterium]|jgi:cell division protein FtsQ|nr:FtsQ-type POTRA domain-containing protein [Opitutaceae bacterium]